MKVNVQAYKKRMADLVLRGRVEPSRLIPCWLSTTEPVSPQFPSPVSSVNLSNPGRPPQPKPVAAMRMEQQARGLGMTSAGRRWTPGPEERCVDSPPIAIAANCIWTTRGQIPPFRAGERPGDCQFQTLALYTQKSVNRAIPAPALSYRLVHGISTRPKVAQPSISHVNPQRKAFPKPQPRAEPTGFWNPAYNPLGCENPRSHHYPPLASRGNSVHLADPCKSAAGRVLGPLANPRVWGQRKGRRGDWWIIAMSCLSLKLRRPREASRDCEEISGEDAQSVTGNLPSGRNRKPRCIGSIRLTEARGNTGKASAAEDWPKPRTRLHFAIDSYNLTAKHQFSSSERASVGSIQTPRLHRCSAYPPGFLMGHSEPYSSLPAAAKAAEANPHDGPGCVPFQAAQPRRGPR
ncbi:hypothetical protein BKA56DRAFT_608539 [Ilyonectria sp. MPI-CAGE-AT-0026]|nr:hypothetical protein BKA56DRAFT_608539 [Ilyonectria sp. MPI-CAGE-AT-0026]